MPAVAIDEPSISVIYRTFHRATHRVFGTAMAHSRGGVVRVQDLLVALAGEAGDLAHAALPEQWRPPPRAAGDERQLIPMSNEPALRKLLRTAHRIACVQQGGWLTPACLWAAVFVDRHAAGRARSLAQIFTQLGVVCPEEWRDQVLELPCPVASAVAPPSVMRKANGPAVDDLLNQIFARWLTLQTEPPGPERQARARELAQLADQVEQLP